MADGDNNGLSRPGFSTYDSNTMTVGDGTWDANRNSFLLPNLVGLNFDTMRYNGMANRFRDLPQYHRLILGHGVVAAITFLGLIPLSIFVSKWGKRWPGPRRSFKLHVYVQVLAIFLVTVVIALGFLAVGPERSFSNPHHGIGLAIYVVYIFIFLQGWLMYRHERKRETFPTKLPFFVWLHNILGRTIAVLAIVQIALGLTLYGSPKVLFILYALWVAFMLFAYLILSYTSLPDHAARPGGGHSEYASDYGSYLSGSRTSYAAPPRREKESHWGRNALGAVGLFGAYEWFKSRRGKRRREEESTYSERYDDRYDGRPPPSSGPTPSQGPPPVGPPAPCAGQQQPYPPPQSGYGPPPPGGYGPPPPGGYGPPPPGPGYGPPPPGGAMRSHSRRPSQSRLSAESWEDEKYSDRPEDHTWRNRILGGIGAFGAYQGVKSLFNRRKRREYDDEYVEDERRLRNRPMEQNSVSRTDVSRVEAGEAPMSPDTPRVNMGGVQPMTPSMTPSRPPRRGPRPSADSISYDSQASYDGPSRRPMDGGDYSLGESVRMMGPMAGFREWNRRRKERRENQRLENFRRQELENEEQYNKRNSMNYPMPQDSSSRRPEESGTLLSGPMTADPGSGVGAPDTSHPPLPANAGSYAPPASNMSESRHNVTTTEGYSLPPPPPGPPPQGVRADGYGASTQDFGSAQMPSGAVEPDPARLVADNTAANESSAYGRDYIAPATAAASLAAATNRRNDDVTSPTRSSRQGSRTRFARPEVAGSTASASISQLNSGASAAPTAGAPATLGGNTTTTGTSSQENPAAAVRVKMHQDGKHATLRLLPEEEAAAERAARRQERRARRRRGSSFSSGGEEPDRYRRRRPSQSQPIANVPPPPASSASWRRNSELNLPPPQQGAPPVPAHNNNNNNVAAASQNTLSPPPPPPAGVGGSVNESGVGSPGAYGTDATGTDVSAFDSNRRRRRAERARREAQLAGGGRPGTRVEFE